jgi:hypothetical protein
MQTVNAINQQSAQYTKHPPKVVVVPHNIFPTINFQEIDSFVLICISNLIWINVIYRKIWYFTLKIKTVCPSEMLTSMDHITWNTKIITTKTLFRYTSYFKPGLSHTTDSNTMITILIQNRFSVIFFCIEEKLMPHEVDMLWGNA